MQNQLTQNGKEQLDRTTSAAICHVIGERLRRDLALDDNMLPSSMQVLLDKMQRQDDHNESSR